MTDVVPFVIAGYPRSGTTALAKLVDSHPETLCLTFEGNILFRLYQMLTGVQDFHSSLDVFLAELRATCDYNFGQKLTAKNYGKVTKTNGFAGAILDLSEKGLTRGTSAHQIFREILIRFFELLQHGGDYRFIGDKVPEYLAIIDVLTANHPNLKVLYIERNPLPVVHSALEFLKKNLHLFVVPDAFAMAFDVALKQYIARQAIEKLPPARVCSVTHAELRENPGQTASRAFAFLGVENPDIAQAVASLGSSAQRVKVWEEEMKSEEAEQVIAVFRYGPESLRSSVSQFADVSPLVARRAEQLWKIVYAENSDLPQVAEDFFASFPESSATAAYALIKYAWLLRLHGDAERTKKILACAPDRSVVPGHHFRTADLFLDIGDTEQAEASYDRCFEQCPQDDYHALLRAKCLAQRGRIALYRRDRFRAKKFFSASLAEKGNFLLAQYFLELC